VIRAPTGYAASSVPGASAPPSSHALQPTLSAWGSVMPVPKKKKSKSKSRSHRAAAWRLDVPARSVCPRCGSAKLPHVVCGNCGWYAGRQAIDVD
jgi:large subunit ribosomal protein L32